ncbi:dicarboxylate/amino acid:cation symporter [Gilvimarinus sp. SDUM040013]|uniref:Dicarboxylate/amino acid:cation symporter n=1 Tax=Gilvimarinus gilvus TaxID=3058038 RepID=A0ABU4RXA9_9GAMM|nr:dicarboxylate/amino acid:cation symporter [Gilvimarinus sp. SDUM040013]MDO3388629.1 dicarboxylate/amino acid:cation symporter [Gilvimarinus sp. SDUM040013]MDX6849524.1 dicarboxylate/amino acid:cation symporter [Gilvimarinus sp. SDUM040013]
MSLTKRILMAMMLGIATGIVLNLLDSGAANSWIQVFLVEGVFDAIGSIFIASLKLLVVPLVFVSLVCGTATLGNHARMGSLAFKTIGLYLLTTAIAISLAITIAIVVAPGEGVEPDTVAVAMDAQAPSIKETLVNIFPDNPVRAMAEGNMLQVIVFSILLGLAISRSGDSAKPMVEFFENLNQVIMKMILMLVHFAPYGVFCLLAKLFAGEGVGVIRNLLWYFCTVIAVLALQCFVVYPSLLKFLAGLNPLIFFRKLSPVLLFGFSSASSNATLPFTLTTVRDKLGVDNKVASFTLPLGATVNMDGTSIMQGVATVFIAQAYAIDVGIGGYLMVVLTATLASIGTAGVPGVGMITLTMVLQQAGLPVEGIAMIIGVDRLLDMLRTSVNITGDATVSSVVANSESLLDRERFSEPTLRD